MVYASCAVFRVWVCVQVVRRHPSPLWVSIYIFIVGASGAVVARQRGVAAAAGLRLALRASGDRDASGATGRGFSRSRRVGGTHRRGSFLSLSFFLKIGNETFGF